MAAPSPQANPVPKPLWDALQSTLTIKSRELIRDIAKTLRQDEKALIATFRAQKKDMYLIEINDPTEERFQCQALLQTTAVAHRCRKPVQYGEKYCPAHRFYTMPDALRNKPSLKTMRSPDGDLYFVDMLTQQVFNVDYQRIGYHKDGKLIIFEIEKSGV